MFKKVLIILFFLSSSLCAEVVNEIIVEGNTRISEETIKVYGEIELNREYSEYDLNKILKNLYSTDFFENVLVDVNENRLKITVKEYPIINTLEIEGEVSNNIKKVILEKIILKENQSFISSKLNEDINLIKQIYNSIGYNFAKVDAKALKISDNRINIIYSIDRGDKIYIKRINFVGDKKLRDRKLRDLIVSEEQKFWKFISKNTYLNQNNIELDKRLLLNYYKSLGYYDVQVLSSNAEIINDSTSLTYTINAGDRYRIKKISTKVDEVFDKTIFKPLESEYINLVGKYYSPFKIKKLLDNLDLLITSNDLQFVEHSINEILDKSEIEIIINVTEGQKTLIERIDIKGNNVTEESVIRSMLLIDEGDPLSNLKLNQSIAKMKSSGIFGEIKSQISDGSNKNQKILELTLEEKPTGEISAGIGVGTSGGTFVFNVKENNWLGKGVNVSTGVEIDSSSFTGRLSVTDPNYNFSGNLLNFFVENSVNDKPDSGYKNNIFVAGIGTRFEQYRDIYLSPGLSFSYDDLKVENSASDSLKKQKGSFSDLSFDYGITSDKRDQAFSPTDGYVASFDQSIPLIADSPYLRNSISFSKYSPLTNDVVGAFKFYSAAINGLQNKDVRLSKRLGLSPSRLRGFEAGKIGPKDGSDYVGGNYAFASSFEMNLPNLLPESTKTDVGLFLDFGNVWHVDYQSNINDSNKIRSSIGLNTSWLSPVGPMTFVFSENISKADTDITESFNFRIGTTF